MARWPVGSKNFLYYLIGGTQELKHERGEDYCTNHVKVLHGVLYAEVH